MDRSATAKSGIIKTAIEAAKTNEQGHFHSQSRLIKHNLAITWTLLLLLLVSHSLPLCLPLISSRRFRSNIVYDTFCSSCNAAATVATITVLHRLSLCLCNAVLPLSLLRLHTLYRMAIRNRYGHLPIPFIIFVHNICSIAIWDERINNNSQLKTKAKYRILKLVWVRRYECVCVCLCISYL